MLYSSLINKAIDIAFEAHKNQQDKCGRPYFVHVFHVAEQMRDEYSVCAALLHDAVEDTDIDIDYLSWIFPKEIIEAVKLLTHDDGIEYFDYVKRLGRNEIARKVKIADLNHNLDISRFSGSSEELLAGYHERKMKYEKAKQFLENIKTGD